MARFLKIAGLIVLVLVIAILVFLWVADFSRYKPKIEAAVSEATGRDFRINGDFQVNVLPSPTVLVEGATLSNPPWASGDNMAEVGHFSATVGLWSLLFRPVVVKDLSLQDVTVNLETDAEGNSNWQFGEPVEEEPEDEESGDMESPVDLRHADIRNVKLVIRAPEVDDRVFFVDELTVQTDDADVQLTAGSGSWNDLPFTIDGRAQDSTSEIGATLGDVEFKSTTSYDGDDINFELSLGTLDNVGTLLEVENLPEEALSLSGDVGLRGDRVELANIVAAVGDAQVTVNGNVDIGQSTVTLTIGSEGDSLSVFSPGLPAIPFKVTADLKAGAESVVIDPFDIRFGDSDIGGSLHANPGDVPSVELMAQSSLIDLAPFSSDEEEGKEEEGKEEEAAKDELVFKDEPLPLDSLRNASANLKWSIDQVKTSTTSLKNVELALALADGKLTTEGSFNGQYGGEYKSSATLDATADPARLSVETNFQDLRIVALSGPDLGPDEIPTTALDVKLESAGNSPRALAASTDGRILVTQGAGKVKNSLIGKVSGDVIAQLFSAFNPFAEEEEYTDWDCSVFALDFESGEGDISAFLLQGEKIMVVGGGKVDLNDEKLNIEFNTKPRKGVGVSADMFVTPFVALTGTLANPHVGLNAKGALLSGGAAVLTGGLSFLYKGLADRATAEAGKCEETLEAVGKGN